MQQLLPFTVLKQHLKDITDAFSRVKLQQLLPFTVLKQNRYLPMNEYKPPQVATALTVYGIETFPLKNLKDAQSSVATALTVYGIETTSTLMPPSISSLQQLLPFTVLKQHIL